MRGQRSLPHEYIAPYGEAAKKKEMRERKQGAVMRMISIYAISKK